MGRFFEIPQRITKKQLTTYIIILIFYGILIKLIYYNDSLFCITKGLNMKKTNILLSSLALGYFIFLNTANAATEDKPKENESILFKIHDIAPEKDVDGNVVACNMSITLFNRYSKAISNSQITLTWDDFVVGETINQEERIKNETVRRNPNAEVSRYPTSANTSSTVSTSIKIPLINPNQQISLKNKVNTDRCFLLINDMDIKVSSCSFAGSAGNDRGCKAIFNYVSPKDPQYYSEFKEITYTEELDKNIDELNSAVKANRDLYNKIVTTLKNIGK